MLGELQHSLKTELTMLQHYYVTHEENFHNVSLTLRTADPSANKRRS